MPTFRIGAGDPRSLSIHIKGWFSKNILLKIASLSLAVFLWFYSATSRVQQEEYLVPISVVVEDTSLVDLRRDHGNASILFEGQGKEFLKLLWKKPHFEFTVDEKKPREIEIPLSALDLVIPEGVHLRPVSILEPQSITVEIDWLTERSVPVLPMVERTDEGYVQHGNVRVEPDEVVVRGARKELRGLKHIPTELVELPSTSGVYEIVAALDTEQFQTLVPSVDSVRITGSIERVIERKLEDIPVEVAGLLSDEYRAVPATIDIIVTGMESKVSGLTPDQVQAMLEINNPPTGETYYSPKIVLPEDVELISEQPKLFQAVAEDTTAESRDQMP